jgi:hypothetical protein
MLPFSRLMVLKLRFFGIRTNQTGFSLSIDNKNTVPFSSQLQIKIEHGRHEKHEKGGGEREKVRNFWFSALRVLHFGRF